MFFFAKRTQHCYFLFLFSDIWEETEGDQSDDDDKTDESMPQYYYYRAVLGIFPLTLDQIRAQIWPNGVQGGGGRKCKRSSS